MKVVPTAIPEVLLLEPEVHRDDRGFFLESYNRRVFQEATGLDVEFVQDNHSRSKQYVLRGLHYQMSRAQGKLVRVVSGEVFDVAVDLRRRSTTFGKAVSIRLNARAGHMLWIPAGFAHGFLVLSRSADVLYKATDYYAPEHEHTLAWNDPQLAIDWPVKIMKPIVSDKDRNGIRLGTAPLYP